jgi:hypothetical protein
MLRTNLTYVRVGVVLQDLMIMNKNLRWLPLGTRSFMVAGGMVFCPHPHCTTILLSSFRFSLVNQRRKEKKA